MSKHNYQNLRAKANVYLLLFVFVFICNITNALAESLHYKAPVLNTENPAYLLPNNFTKISLATLKVLKEEHESNLELLQKTRPIQEISEKKLLNSLIAYDDVRLQITDIILTLVEEYNVTGKYKKKLLGYSDTFKTTIKPARNTVNTLDEYKVYSTHFAVVYISLLYAFKEEPAFFAQYMNDINDHESTIGKFRRELAISFKQVEKAQKEYESIAIAQKLEQSVVQLGKEIKMRETRLNAQNRVDLNL